MVKKKSGKLSKIKKKTSIKKSNNNKPIKLENGGIILPTKPSNTEIELKQKAFIGRPPAFRTPEEMQELVDQYFVDGMNRKEVVVGPPNNRQVRTIPVPTISGLALYLGFCNRRSLYEYEENPAFTLTIKKARARIESHYEELLQTTGGAAIIFALKNIGGWRDKTELEVTDNTDLAKKIMEGRKRAGILKKKSDDDSD